MKKNGEKNLELNTLLNIHGLKDLEHELDKISLILVKKLERKISKPNMKRKEHKHEIK